MSFGGSLHQALSDDDLITPRERQAWEANRCSLRIQLEVFVGERSGSGRCRVKLLICGAGLGQADRLVENVDMNNTVLCRIADNAERIASLLHNFDLLSQQL